MRNRDVAIIGGGPAGSSCAWALRRAGADVEVLDRQKFPRDKICAGWITPAVAGALELDLASYAGAGNTLQPIYGFRVGMVGRGDVAVSYADPISYGIRRCEFDHYLLRRSGVPVRLGEPVRKLRRSAGAWVIDEELRARYVVGAGGHFCPVAQHLGGRVGHHEAIIAAQEIEFRLPAVASDVAVDATMPEILFTPDLQGYGWIFRKGGYLNVGLGRQGNQRLSNHVAEFVAQAARENKIPSVLPKNMRGHPYLLYDRAERPLTGEGILLVGDAGGLAYGKSGEGIRPAVESGLLAAEAIATTADARDGQARYAELIQARMGPRTGAPSLTDWLPQALVRQAAARLFTRQWFARRVILDDWFLHRSLPGLRSELRAASQGIEPADLRQGADVSSVSM